MSHFLEHMLFKGTPLHTKGDLDKLLARYGALWNAFTSEDVTCYFETVRRERYPVALELEADRMRNALISREETEAERTVIVSEREGLENDPSFLLGEQLQAIAFNRHPYGQGVIGSKDEIKLMTRDGLYAHYRRHYAPNNAYVIVVGDASPDELVDRATQAFMPLDAEANVDPPKAPEPPQYVEKVILEELARISRDPVTDDEFARVRRQLLSATAFTTDTVTWRAWRWGSLLATGAATSLDDWYARLAAVTVDEVRGAAAATFSERKRNVGWFVPEAA